METVSSPSDSNDTWKMLPWHLLIPKDREIYVKMNDNSFSQEDDISILQSEDDVNAVSPHVIPYFNLTASRHQLPTTSGITSMEALRNAYEELKKKYNELNLKYHSLLKFVHKNRMSEFIPDELPSGSHSLDEKSQALQISRKDEIEKLHNAILRLNHELSEEKSKNLQLQVQINTYKVMSQPDFKEGQNDKSLDILEDLKKNINILERSVELHKTIINKQWKQKSLPLGCDSSIRLKVVIDMGILQSKQKSREIRNIIENKSEKSQTVHHAKHLDDQPLFGKSDFISQRKQQSEHDELSSLGNKPGHGPIKVTSSASPNPSENAKSTACQHISEDVKTKATIVDLKSVRQKQDRKQDKTNTHASSLHFCKNISLSSPSSSLSQSPLTPTINNTNSLVREKDSLFLNNAESLLPNDNSEMLCPICEKPFIDLSKFQEHVFYCTNEPLERSCPLCMKNFKNAAQKEFEQHVHTHFDQPGDDYDVLNF